MVSGIYSSPIYPKSNQDIKGIIHVIPSIIVEAYSSSVGDNQTISNGPHNAVNPLSSHRWQSENFQNQWIVFNFTQNSVFTTHYGVQSVDTGPGNAHAKKWKFFGFTNYEWVELDEVSESKINGAKYVETRIITNNGPYSAFKILSTGDNWNYPETNYMFRFLNVDVFGSLMLPSNQNIHCNSMSLLFIQPGFFISSMMLFSSYSVL